MDIGQFAAFVNAGEFRGIDSKPLSRFLRRARRQRRYYAASESKVENFYFIEHIWHALRFGVPIAVVPMCVTWHKPREVESIHRAFCKRYDELRGAIALMQYCKENGVEIPLKATPKWKKAAGTVHLDKKAWIFQQIGSWPILITNARNTHSK